MTEERIEKLGTEQKNSRTANLDEMNVEELLSVMNEEDHICADAVKEALPQIAEAVRLCRKALVGNGRMIYIGAGTSGRLGVLDAAECIPTFSSRQVIGRIAGGEKAMFEAVEGAEDDPTLAEQDLKELSLNENDVVIGLAASGRTPYVIGGLQYARTVNAKTVAVSCNKDAVISQYADAAIEVNAGPEVLTGSSRLKAGTCQKMICNMLSTATMAGIGKIYGNLMVDMIPSNGKLENRAIRIVSEATGCSEAEAKETLEKADWKIKTAVVMMLGNCDANSANQKLSAANGFVRTAIKG